MQPEQFDPKTLHFVYIQAADEIISGNQPIVKEHAIQLASLQLHVDQVRFLFAVFVFAVVSFFLTPNFFFHTHRLSFQKKTTLTTSQSRFRKKREE